MTERIPMTKEGIQKLRAELEQLKSVARPQIIKEVAEARAHGDLKENAEYHAAREQHSFIEGRIKELEGVISFAQEIDPTKLNVGDRIVFGAYIKLLNLTTDTSVEYRIVGEYETNLGEKYISNTSPIARTLLGNKKGDYVTVKAPSGNIDYFIQDIRY